MSDYLHRTRLRWCSASGTGVAIHDGVHVELRARPRVLLNTARLIELEYSPAIGVLYVQEATGARRDMQTGEAAECLAYLRGMSLSTRTYMDAQHE
jgi:hypothetical protein